VKEDSVYLRHILDALERIRVYTREGRAAFLADPKTQDAVVRNLEIVGEAVKNVSEAVRQAAPEVPWKRIAGMRDILIHAYFGVNLETVWGVVETEVPAFHERVRELLSA
jgi:uncharacterized protein with HEPN domain